MRFVKFISSIMLTVFLFVLCSCAKGDNNVRIEISPSDKSLIDLSTHIYDESQLLELVRFDGTINELNMQYPVDCLREDNGTYRASYLGDESVAILLFDEDGNRLLGKTYGTPLEKSDFDGLVKGQFLEDVISIDPNGEYIFLYTGSNDVPKVSYHYTKDGYLITIEYNDFNSIISINQKLI